MFDIKAEYSIPVDHASLAGHFPGNPVIPGVVILQKVLRTITLEKPSTHYKIVMAKFLQPLIPPATLTVYLSASSENRINFKAMVDKDVISNGIIEINEQSHVQ
ncbi:MAG: hypothetical protein KAU21_18265 [Gammaproteobacteria bacterium]|nr:hypothetical protein [Gammaproteobacteria bacterium]